MTDQNDPKELERRITDVEGYLKKQKKFRDYSVDYQMKGRGNGLCDVYKASDKDKNPCVVKVLKPVFQKYSHVVDEFLKAAEGLTRLDHPNIAKYFEYGRDEIEGPYLVMESPEYCLDSIDKKTLSLLDVMNIVQQLAAALAYAHEKGVYHNCIHPCTVFYDKKTGAVKLADFRLATVLWHAESAQNQDEGFVILPGYIISYCPEEGWNLDEYDDHETKTRKDVNSLGCLFYDLLTGEPFWGSGVVCSMWPKDLKTRFNIVKERNKDIPAELIELLKDMLGVPEGELKDDYKDTSYNRYRIPSIKEVVERLEQIKSRQGKSKGIISRLLGGK